MGYAPKARPGLSAAAYENQPSAHLFARRKLGQNDCRYHRADPKKLLNKGISVPLYEGHVEGDKLQPTLRETRHLEGAYIPRTMVAFLNLVSALPLEQQMLILRLTMDVMLGRECTHIEVDGEPIVYFPDQRGDPQYDVFLRFGGEEKKQKAASKTASKSRSKSPEKRPAKKR